MSIEPRSTCLRPLLCSLASQERHCIGEYLYLLIFFHLLAVLGGQSQNIAICFMSMHSLSHTHTHTQLDPVGSIAKGVEETLVDA